MAEQRAQWGSRMGFILAASGSAVGLGNIWKTCIAPAVSWRFWVRLSAAA